MELEIWKMASEVRTSTHNLEQGMCSAACWGSKTYTDLPYSYSSNLPTCQNTNKTSIDPVQTIYQPALGLDPNHDQNIATGETSQDIFHYFNCFGYYHKVGEEGE